MKDDGWKVTQEMKDIIASLNPQVRAYGMFLIMLDAFDLGVPPRDVVEYFKACGLAREDVMAANEKLDAFMVEAGAKAEAGLDPLTAN